MAKLEPGQIAYGPLTDEEGLMVDDCTVMVRSADSIRFCGANDRDYELFSEKAPEVEVREFTDAMPHLCLQGPKSREWLQGLTDADLSNDVFPYYRFREDVSIAGIPVFMTRLGYTAELGYELWVDESRALELWDALLEALEPQGMRIVGMVALDLFRIEGGFIIGGIEYDATVSPYECGLGWGRRSGEGRIPRTRGAVARRRRDKPPPDDGRARVGRRQGAALGSSSTARRSGSSRRRSSRRIGTARPSGSPRSERPPRARHEGRGADRRQTVAGEVVRHPVYDPERRRAKLS